MDETPTQTANRIPLLLGGVILIIVIIGVGVWLLGQRNTDSQPQQGAMQQETTQVTPTIATDVMEGATPSAAVMTEATTVQVEGGGFYFKPNEIRVKKNQKIKIVFTNAQGIHDFVIDEFNVKTETISGGKTAEVTFTPDKTGTFEFYCSVGNHRAMGMKGNLIVE